MDNKLPDPLNPLSQQTGTTQPPQGAPSQPLPVTSPEEPEKSEAINSLPPDPFEKVLPSSPPPPQDESVPDTLASTQKDPSISDVSSTPVVENPPSPVTSGAIPEPSIFNNDPLATPSTTNITLNSNEPIPAPQPSQELSPQQTGIEPPPPLTPNPSAVFESPKHSGKGFPKLFLLALFFAILIGIGAAYFVAGSSKSQPEEPPKMPPKAIIPSPTDIPNPTVVPSQISTPSPTIESQKNTTIKTYQNKKYGYSLTYPANWIFNENVNQYGSIRFSDSKKAVPGLIGDVSITTYQSSLALDKWIESGHPVFGKDLNTYYPVVQNTTINGNPVTIMTGGSGSTYGKVAYIKQAGYVHELFLQGTAVTIKGQMENSDIFTDILSSLAFTSSQP